MKNISDYKELGNLLFPNTHETMEDMLKKYPARAGSAFRLAPSPTGYLHIGSLGMCIVNTRLARSTGGVAYLRIEDTDQKREVEGAVPLFISALEKFGIKFDEGFDGASDYGNYGPYVQSKRTAIYHVFAKKLVELGLAYPCFCTETDLENLRKQQEGAKTKTGYYGEHASCKKLTLEQIRENLRAAKPWALRFDSGDMEGTRITWKDCIKGDMSLPAEINNPVIIKSNGIPPYNFAHVVDDTLMRTSHVIRGEEWLVSTAEHIQLFNALGLTHPNYAHPPVICVEENGNKRKLSKRKDREAVAESFLDLGYPPEAVTEYLMTLYNTDFEMWRIKNPLAPNTDFAFKFETIGSNSPLFDWNKLNDISKNIIAKKSCTQINGEVKKFFLARTDNESQAVIKNLDKVYAVLAIDRETEKPRKDIIKYSDIYELYNYLFDEWSATDNNFSTNQKEILKEYAEVYDPNNTKDEWFENIKKMCRELGYSDSVKDFKQNPSAYKGHIGDVTQTIRVAITGRENTPDLYQILKIIGHNIMLDRLNKII